MNDHTPEPWMQDTERFREHCIRGGGLPVAEVWHTGNQQANARRIVACVNACAGLSTELLECKTIDKAADTIANQRDELSVALQVAADRLEARGHVMGAREARAVLAKVQS